MDLHQERLAFLSRKGFSPQIVYDIGAFRGTWTNQIKMLFPKGQFYLFEANQEHEPYLRSPYHNHFITLLGDEDKETTFYSINNTGDSLFREQTHYYQGMHVKEKTLQMNTLSSFVKKNALPLPNLVKIDVQGAEKIVIQGGMDVISHAEVVILETKILEYNAGAPSILELMMLMHSLEYRLLDIIEFHYLSSGELNEVDLLFVKNNSQLIKTGLLE